MDSLDLKANEVIEISGKCYRLIHLLGRGKGGYSWLADCDDNPVVVKQIHHEPCRVYSFGNKIDAERYAYERLKAIDIRIPKMLAIDMAAERLAKEYIEGPTIFELVRDGSSAEPWIRQVREMAEKAKAAGINIDYFSPNFVIQAHTNLLYYIDYECTNTRMNGILRTGVSSTGHRRLNSSNIWSISERRPNTIRSNYG